MIPYLVTELKNGWEQTIFKDISECKGVVISGLNRSDKVESQTRNDLPLIIGFAFDFNVVKFCHLGYKVKKIVNDNKSSEYDFLCTNFNRRFIY
jgi:hypothetical protein